MNTKFIKNGKGKKRAVVYVEYAKETNRKYIAMPATEFMDVARAIEEKRGFIKTKEIEYSGKTYWIIFLN